MRHLVVTVTYLALAGPLIAQSTEDLAIQNAGAVLLWGDNSTRQDRSDIQRVALGNDIYVERLQGEAALAHLYNVMSRRPEAFTAARRALRDRGFRATGTVYVERTVRLAKNSSGETGSMVLPAQSYSEQNSDGEIVFWSWDDGNNATWEGSIYVEVYATGAASTWEGQIDASTQEHPWIWYEKTWEGTGGGGPREVSFEGMPPRPGAFGKALPAVISKQTAACSGYALAGFAGWARCWRQCVVAGCTTAAIGCVASGPAWPECFGLWCTGAEAGCALACAMGD